MFGTRKRRPNRKATRRILSTRDDAGSEDEDGPSVVISSSRSRNLRTNKGKRPAGSSSNTKDGPKASSRRTRASDKKSKVHLSFAGDEEDESDAPAFPLKKSLHSRRISDRGHHQGGEDDEDGDGGVPSSKDRRRSSKRRRGRMAPNDDAVRLSTHSSSTADGDVRSPIASSPFGARTGEYSSERLAALRNATFSHTGGVVSDGGGGPPSSSPHSWTEQQQHAVSLDVDKLMVAHQRDGGSSTSSAAATTLREMDSVSTEPLGVHDVCALEARLSAEDGRDTQHAALQDSSPADSTTLIADKMRIRHAREKRERIRTHGDFIPLEGASSSSSSSTTARGSGGCAPPVVHERLVREDDEDDSSGLFADERGRIGFGASSTRKGARQIAKERIKASLYDALEQSSDDDDDAEELRRWELQQMSTGVRGKDLSRSKVDMAMSRVGADGVFARKVMEDELARDQGALGSSTSMVGRPASHEQSRESVRRGRRVLANAEKRSRSRPTIEQVRERLQKAARGTAQALEERRKRLSDLKGERDALKEEMASVHKRIAEASGQYEFYQGVEEYTADLQDCLRVKREEIDTLKDQLVGMLKQRRRDLQRRRLKEYEEGLAEATGVSNEDGGGGEAEVDDLGRDLGAKRRGAAHKRKQRRRRKRERVKQRRSARMAAGGGAQEAAGQARGEHAGGGHGDEPEDYETDEYTSEEEGVRYQRDAQRLAEAGDGVLGDVHEDYTSVRSVCEAYQEWRTKHTREYVASHAPMQMCLLVRPLVELELLDWNPLEKPHFDWMDWYRALVGYTQPLEKAEEEEEEGEADGGHAALDPDSMLVPQVVAEVVLPHVEKFLCYAFSPLSTKASRNAVKVVEELGVYLQALPASTCVAMQKTITTAVVVAIAEATETFNVPIVPDVSPTTRDGEESPGYAFCVESFWMGVKLLGNVSMWANTGALSLRAVSRYIEKVLNDALLPFLKRMPLPADFGICALEAIFRRLPTSMLANKSAHDVGGPLGLLHSTVVGTRGYDARIAALLAQFA